MFKPERKELYGYVSPVLATMAIAFMMMFVLGAFAREDGDTLTQPFVKPKVWKQARNKDRKRR